MKKILLLLLIVAAAAFSKPDQSAHRLSVIEKVAANASPEVVAKLATDQVPFTFERNKFHTVMRYRGEAVSYGALGMVKVSISNDQLRRMANS